MTDYVSEVIGFPSSITMLIYKNQKLYIKDYKIDSSDWLFKLLILIYTTKLSSLGNLGNAGQRHKQMWEKKNMLFQILHKS